METLGNLAYCRANRPMIVNTPGILKLLAGVASRHQTTRPRLRWQVMRRESRGWPRGGGGLSGQNGRAGTRDYRRGDSRSPVEVSGLARTVTPCQPAPAFNSSVPCRASDATQSAMAR